VEVRKLRLNLMIHAVVEAERSIRIAAAKKGKKRLYKQYLFSFCATFLVAIEKQQFIIMLIQIID